MNIFNHLNDILFTKERNLSNIDDEQEYNQYMVNRWISMYSPKMASFINNTTNWLYPVMEEKSFHYNFLHRVLPQVKRKHINYIKKSTEKQEEVDNLDLLAQKLELSKREVKYFIDNSHENQH
jgi:hypothetical protein